MSERRKGPRAVPSEIRAIPSDHAAERDVLGAILLDNDVFGRVGHLLSGAAFDLPRHRIVYEAMLALSVEHTAVTLLTLQEELRHRNLLEEIGGPAFIAGLADCPTAAHAESHATLLRKKALGRGLIRTCERIAERGYDGGEPIEDLLEHAERQILQLAQGHTPQTFQRLQAVMDEAMIYCQQVQRGELVGAQTGFADLDAHLGGLGAGNLVVLAARPGIGKTALALGIAIRHATRFAGCVGFYSLEMQARELALRVLLGEAQIDGSRFRKGVLSDREQARMSEAAYELQQTRMWIDESSMLTVSEIAGKARKLHREQQLSLIVVDYLQLMLGRSDLERREQQVADASRSLKGLAKELGIPVLALSQLNRNLEARADKRPMLSDLRESGAIEQDADVVLFIHRDTSGDLKAEPAAAELIIAKNRHGSTGSIALHFDTRTGRFENAARDGEESTPGFGPDESIF